MRFGQALKPVPIDTCLRQDDAFRELRRVFKESEVRTVPKVHG